MAMFGSQLVGGLNCNKDPTLGYFMRIPELRRKNYTLFFVGVFLN